MEADDKNGRNEPSCDKEDGEPEEGPDGAGRDCQNAVVEEKNGVFGEVNSKSVDYLAGPVNFEPFADFVEGQQNEMLS